MGFKKILIKSNYDKKTYQYFKCHYDKEKRVTTTKLVLFEKDIKKVYNTKIFGN